MSVLDAVLKQYEKNKQSASGNTNKVSQEERLKKYFTTVLPKGVTTMEKRIRLLPPKDDGTPFVESRFHELQVDGNWVKLYDPAFEGKRSPLNEVYDELKASTDPEDVKLASNYYSRKFYIVKLIDRDKEQDGVKFWRFKHNTKGEGVFDKIQPIFKNKGDITDPEKGRDLILTLTLTKSGKNKEYTVVSSVIPDDVSPLHEDQNIVNEWVNDPLTWTDVYSKKPEEYLTIVAEGKVPKWNMEEKKWVSSEDAKTGEVTFVGTSNVVDPQEDDEPNDDLPF